VNDRGEAVASAWLRRAETLPVGYRALLVYAGRKTGRKILDLLPARDDIVLVAIQYPYESPRTLGAKLRFPVDARRAAFRAVAGGLLAVSLLERDEGIDPARVAVVGSSLGSAFAVPHAALDRRVGRLVIVHGGGDLPLVVRELEAARGRPVRARVYAAATWLLAAPFEPLRYVAEVAPRETIVVGARTDRTFPAASTQALFDAALEPKRLLWTTGAHVRSAPGVELDEVVRVLDGLLEAPGPP
jgi:dienelactone hydrolase